MQQYPCISIFVMFTKAKTTGPLILNTVSPESYMLKKFRHVSG